MKKILAFVALLMLVCLAVTSASAETYATVKQPIVAYTGPGTEYVETGVYLRSGDIILARTKVWNPSDRSWWVQIEFSVANGGTGTKIRAYTAASRLNVDLNRLPEEVSMGSCMVTEYSDAFTGPFYMDFIAWSDSIYENTQAILYEVEDGFAHIECWNRGRQQIWRAWVKLDNLSCAYQYDYDHYWGSADDLPSAGNQTVPYNPPSTSGNASSGVVHVGNTSYPTGADCMVIASSAHIRSGPGVEYPQVGCVWDYECFTILDWTVGSTGKKWYLIDADGGYGWISSGLTVMLH